jgi:hypothetical protein
MPLASLSPWSSPADQYIIVATVPNQIAVPELGRLTKDQSGYLASDSVPLNFNHTVVMYIVVHAATSLESIASNPLHMSVSWSRVGANSDRLGAQSKSRRLFPDRQTLTLTFVYSAMIPKGQKHSREGKWSPGVLLKTDDPQSI